jgi:hypothetical protein
MKSKNIKYNLDAKHDLLRLTKEKVKPSDWYNICKIQHNIWFKISTNITYNILDVLDEI